jgi:hypothetical protein
MDKENRIPLPRRRSGSDGPAPTALVTTAHTASDDGPAGSDPRLGQHEEGKTGDGPGAGHSGMGSAEDRPGLGGAGERAGASSGLPRRVRGMSDGPRPPAQVARPALPASFLERVRAAAEAEQRLEERAQERAGQPATPPVEPPAVQPGPPRRPARFVRGRDWMARNGDKERDGRGQPRPGPQGGTAGDHSGTARPATASVDLWTARGSAEPDQAPTPATPGVLGTDGASAGPPAGARPSAPPELPRRKPRVSHRRDPAQAGPVAAVSTEGGTVEASTEPIPVIRVSATGEPLPPEGVDQGSPAPDGRPVTAAVQAPDQTAAPSPEEQAPVVQAPLEQAPAERAPVRQAPVDQAPAEQAPLEQAPAAPVTPGMPLGHSRRSRGKAGLRARVARGLAGAPQPPASPEVPDRQHAVQPASQLAQEQAAAQGTSAAAGAAAVPEAPALGEPARQAPADQAPAAQAAAEQEAAVQRAAERQAQQAAAQRKADEAVVQRTAAALARKSSPVWTRRRVSLAAAVVLVLGGVAAGVAFLGSGGHQSRQPSPGAASTAVVNRDRAAAWVASQVSPASMVSCDPATCVLIESHGFPTSHVRVLGPGKGNPLVSNVVVATPTVRSQFGAQLTSVYAPCLLATFGSGSRQVDVQLVAPHGVAAYRAALNADLQNRRQSGAGLSGSNRIQAPFTARKQLAAGQVDSRLMITLALMASLQPVHLVTFSDGGPDPDSAPLRSAELSVTGSARKKAVLAFLRQQQPPYRPARVTTKPKGRDRTLLIMEFTAPSPVGLFH